MIISVETTKVIIVVSQTKERQGKESLKTDKEVPIRYKVKLCYNVTTTLVTSYEVKELFIYCLKKVKRREEFNKIICTKGGDGWLTSSTLPVTWLQAAVANYQQEDNTAFSSKLFLYYCVLDESLLYA